MPLEGFGAPVVVVPTDLAVVVDVQPVELIEPVGDGLEQSRVSAKASTVGGAESAPSPCRPSPAAGSWGCR